jgi:RNA polymerase sigma-70 factor, ECF subfamily
VSLLSILEMCFEEHAMNSINKHFSTAEEELVKQAMEGCLDAFNQLVLCYQNLAYHHAYTLLGDVASAEDITQESFIKAFKNIGSFRGGSFRGWLLKIVTNTAFDFLRQSRQHLAQSLVPEDDHGDQFDSQTWMIDPSAWVETIVEQNEESKRLYQLLDELPDIYRNVITLADLYEMDYWEVAGILNIPMGTVKSRLARARLLLKSRLLDEVKYLTCFDQKVSVAPSWVETV